MNLLFLEPLWCEKEDSYLEKECQDDGDIMVYWENDSTSFFKSLQQQYFYVDVMLKSVQRENAF